MTTSVGRLLRKIGGGISQVIHVWRRDKKFYVALFILCTLVTSCKDISIPVNVSVGDNSNKPIAADTLRQVRERMGTYTELASTSDNCPSAVVPAKEVDSDFQPGRCSDDALKCLDECVAKSNGPSCYALAIRIEDNAGGPDDHSAWLYLKACEFGVVSGCTNRAAGMLRRDRESEQVKKCSADTFEKTCALDDRWGCASYSLALTAGIGREVDLDAALIAAGKACKNDEEDPACGHAKKLTELIKRKQKLEAPVR